MEVAQLGNEGLELFGLVEKEERLDALYEEGEFVGVLFG